jgi:hypothetical protein
MDEILVHITAPTTRKDDELYRSLADAYHAFEPYQVNVPDGTGTKKTRSGDATIHLPPEPRESFMSKGSYGRYGSFPSYVPSASLDDVPEPSGNHDSSHAMEDSCLDSSRLAQLERIQRNWRQEMNKRLSSSGVPKSSGKASEISFQDTKFLEDTQLAAQAIQDQLPDDFSTTSEDTSEDEDDFVPDFHSTVKPGSLLPGPTQEPAEDLDKQMSRATSSASNEPSPLLQKRGAAGTETHGEETSRAIFITHQSESKSPVDEFTLFSVDDDGVHEDVDFSNLPVELLPPGPKISIEAPSVLPSQLTPFLTTVRLENHARFKHAKTQREVAADERGYWLVETEAWPQSIQYGFWSLLCEHVRNGSLGWGVFLCREPSGGDHGLGKVRVYCWGEVVEEIWLVLSLCSRGKISGSGSSWLDAEEVVVIQVP